MNDNLLVSVIIPLYNGRKYIEAALMSVVAQTYSTYEVIVIDDGSTDDGPIKVEKIIKDNSEQIRLIYHADHANHGIAASRNLGIRNAKGLFVAFIDQDDLWMPCKLQKQIDVLRIYPDVGLVYGKVTLINEEGNEKKLQDGYSIYGKGFAGAPRNIFVKLLFEDFIPNQTVLIRKSCIERVGYLDEGPRYEYEDWLLLSKVAFFYKAIFVPEILAKWRLHTFNYSDHIFKSGQFGAAEEHCTIALFSFLLNEAHVPLKVLRKYLHLRIWRFFFRARSWGISKDSLAQHAVNFIGAFPSEYKTIKIAMRFSLTFPVRITEIFRRIRRHIIGL